MEPAVYGGGDPVLADNKGDELEMVASGSKDMECQGLKKSGDNIPNTFEDKLSLGVREIRLDEPRDGHGDHGEGHRSENFGGPETNVTDTEKVMEELESIMENPCHLPVEMWEKILEFVGHEDLKSMRGVCSYMNTVIVPNWTRLVQTSCLIYDGNVQISTIESTEGNEKVVPDSDLLQKILPYFRMRNIPSKCIIPIKSTEWSQAEMSVKTLELTDCVMHWTDVLDLLNCFKCLENFKIYMNPEKTKEANKAALSTFLAGLEQELLLEKTPEWTSKNFSTHTPFPIPTLKTVAIDIPFMHCVNTVLRILEYKCNNLENLSITMDRERMANSSIEVGERRPCRLDAGDLLLKNVETFKKFNLKLIPEFIRKDDSPDTDYYLNSYPATGILLSFLDIRGLKLEELCFDLPIYFIGYDVEDEILNERRESIMAPFRQFLKDQKQCLKILRISGFGWYEGADENFREETIGDSVDIYIKLVVFGGNEELNPNWALLKDKMEAVEIRWNGLGGSEGSEFLSLPAIFKGNTDAEPMEKVRSFSMYNHKITFVDIDLPFIVEKFPNLTCLKIINLAKIEGYACMNENGDGPLQKQKRALFNIEIHNCQFQIILKKLQNLHTLHLDCEMEDLTDFGLTGVSDEAIARMKMNNNFKIESDDKTGYSLAELKKLIYLKLIGVGGKVTNASVWLALRKLPLLKELVIVGKHKITETAKTYLKIMVEKRVGSHFEIEKPMKEPSKQNQKEYYVYKRMDD